MRVRISAIFFFYLVFNIGFVACTPLRVVETVIVTREVEGKTIEKVVTATPEVTAELVTLYGYVTKDIATLDPQLAEDMTSIDYIENLFVNLTNHDPATADVVPEAAKSWTISEDGLVYTFLLRTDIPWVYHNPITLETTQEIDEDGQPRFVTAYDFEYSIKRMCDPKHGSYYNGVIAPLIRGCEEVYLYEQPAEIPPELIDAIGVQAVDEETLVIRLESAAAYFLSMTPMWNLAAVPHWAIEQHGEDWIEAGNIVTNGRYTLNEWVHSIRQSMRRNPLIPSDLAGEGNIDVLVTSVVPDVNAGYELWLNHQVDLSAVPDSKIQAHLDQFPDQTSQIPDQTVFHISFRTSKPPFDDVRVRRAFSAAFDRDTFIATVLQGQAYKMIHFAPPGVFGAPPIDEVGIDFDPEFARQMLAQAGYPRCEGFPQVILVGYSGKFSLDWLEYAQRQWEKNLGCDSRLITIEQLSFSELFEITKSDVPEEDVPHMWTLGWGPVYADENSWVGDALWCKNESMREKRTCTEVDDLIVDARIESDAIRRIELYREIEERLFGVEGEVPFIPIWLRTDLVAKHDWLDGIQVSFGGEQFYNWRIDQSAQLAARNR